MKKKLVLVSLHIICFLFIYSCENSLRTETLEDDSENISFENKEAEDYYNSAIDNVNNDNIKSAKSYYLKALKLEKDHPNILNNLGNVYYRLNNIDSAELCFLQIIETSPKFGTVYPNLTHLYNNSNRYSKGVEIAKRGLKICKDSLQLAALNFNLSISYLNLNDCLNAKKNFNTYLLLIKDKYTFLAFEYLELLNRKCN